MFSYLFQSVTGIVFEPLAVTLLLWCILAFGFFRKKNKVLFWFFTGAVIFMLVWRLACHSVMVSARYAAFLIYPTVICCACFTFKCAPFFRWLFKKFKLEFPGRNAFCRLISVAVFIGLSIGCLIKTFRIDPYATHLKQAAQFYVKHRRGPGELYIAEKAHKPISWYVGLKEYEANLLYVPENASSFQYVRNTVELLRNVPGEHYLFFYLKKGEVEPSQEIMKLAPDYGSWKIVARYYTTKRKKEELLVARYKPVCPDIQEWKQPMPLQSAKNLHPNGDFEKKRSASQIKILESSYRKLQVKDCSLLTQIPLPTSWGIVINKWNAPNPPVVRLSDKNPLAGKYSLVIDARQPRSHALCNSWYYFNKRCKYTIFARGEGDNPSKIQISIGTQNLKLKKFRLEKRWEFRIDPGKVYRLQGTIPLDTFEKDWQNFNLQIGVRGYVTVDQLSLVPY